MNVYGEILFAENAVMGGVILYITSLISEKLFDRGKKMPAGDFNSNVRMVVGGIMCGAFSFVIFIPLNIIWGIVIEASFALLVCCVVLGKRALWKKALTFIIVTYFMGGIVMGLLLITQNSGIYTMSGVYTGDMKAAMLAVFTAASLLLAKKTIAVVSDRKFYSEHIFDVTLYIGDATFNTKAFLDTGNTLKEPVSSIPVAVASDILWEEIIGSEKTGSERVCVIPYETVESKGILMGIKIDNIAVNGIKTGKCAIAKGDGSFKIWFDEKADEKPGLLICREMVYRK